MSAGGFRINISQAGALLVIAAIVAAFVWGFQHDPPRQIANDWRNHEVAENNFAVATPGMLLVNQQPISFGSEDVTAKTYMASDFGMDYSVLVAHRPDSDTRSYAQVAKDMRLSGAGAGEEVGDLVVFHHDVAVEGKRTQAVVYFQDRMMYQLMASARMRAFSPPDAVRFFNSFHVLKASAPSGAR